MMDIVRRSLKAYIVSMAVFALLTFVLAALLCFTGYKESWTFPGLLISLSVGSMLFGFMEGNLAGSKGLLVGFASAILFLLSILLFVGGLFADQLDSGSVSIYYLIPVLAGIVGGILGTNMKK